MKDIDTLLKEVKRIHFIGIGGSGVPWPKFCCPWAISCPARTITTPRLFAGLKKRVPKSI